MSEDPTQASDPVRYRAGVGERYEIEHLASRHGLTPDEARQLIERFGSDREALDREAEKIRRR